MYNTKGYQILSAENILKKVTEYDIFKYYISGLEAPGKKFCSELRKDRNPSCSIKYRISDSNIRVFDKINSHSYELININMVILKQNDNVELFTTFNHQSSKEITISFAE